MCVCARVCIHTQPIVMRYKSYIRRWRRQYISRVDYLGECKKICQPQKCEGCVSLGGRYVFVWFQRDKGAWVFKTKVLRLDSGS